MKELSKEYRNDEDKRQLLRECSLFLADRNVSEDIPKRLGKAFYKARREPVYVTLDRADLKGHLERAISCTLMRPNRGNTMAIKIGNTGQKVEHIFENVSKVIPSVIGHVPERWENMNGLHLSINGLSLPIWSRAVGSEKTKAPPDVSAEESAESEELENSGAEAVVPESPKTAKKRKSENSENVDQPPRKRSSTKGQKKVKKGKTSG
ncbi:hypothetical protein FRB99_007958 [Tulasnella sp. 403]|nr:hypothetical protein FRB99_007958 [Tulasnella sp. 403]